MLRIVISAALFSAISAFVGFSTIVGASGFIRDIASLGLAIGLMLLVGALETVGDTEPIKHEFSK